jgi:hypothetical protein
MGSSMAAWYSSQTSSPVPEEPIAPPGVLLPVFFLGGGCCIILHLVWIVIVVLLGGLWDGKLLITVNTHTLVAPLRPSCLGGWRLLVLLVLPLRRPFLGGGLLLFLRRGLIAGFLLVRLVLRWVEMKNPRFVSCSWFIGLIGFRIPEIRILNLNSPSSVSVVYYRT